MQRCNDEITAGLYPQVQGYVDDFIIGGATFDEHLEHLTTFLARVVTAGIFLKLAKCQFGRTTVKLLGVVVTHRSVTADPKKVEAIIKARPPRDKKELKSLVGTLNYLSKFVPRYSERAAVLTDLLVANVVYAWTDAHQKAYEELRDELATYVMLSSPTPDGQLVLITDASLRAVGAALCQIQDDDVVILEFASKKLSPAERAWTARELEAYAIRWACEHFEQYLRGRKTIVLTDHESLQWLEKSTNGKVLRWSLFLAQFPLVIHHIDGELNVIADWLSRTVDDGDSGQDSDIDDMSWSLAILTDSARREAAPYRLPTLSDLREAVDEVEPYEERETMVLKDGLRYHKFGRLYVPLKFRSVILFWWHAGPRGCHQGGNRTGGALKRHLWWPHLERDAAAFVAKCLVCARYRSVAPRTARGVLERPGLFQLVSIDNIGPHDWSARQYWITVILDHHSRFMVARVHWDPPNSQTMKATMEDAWVAHFGAPEGILCDRGPEFRDVFARYAVRECAGALIYTSPAYPRGNAINESSHRLLEHTIRSRTAHQTVDSLEEVLRDAVLAYNAAPHLSLGQPPFYVMTGQDLILPGWQRFARYPTAEQRHATIRDYRLRAMLTALVREEDFKAIDTIALQEGDIILYALSPYEITSHAGHPHSDTIKNVPKWSAPQRVTRVKDRVVLVKPLWGTGEPRQVPVSLVKKFPSALPEPLHRLALNMIEMERPRYGKLTDEQWQGYRTPVDLASRTPTHVPAADLPKTALARKRQRQNPSHTEED